MMLHLPSWSGGMVQPFSLSVAASLETGMMPMTLFRRHSWLWRGRLIACSQAMRSVDGCLGLLFVLHAKL
jgi:hypothetical protein